MASSYLSNLLTQTTTHYKSIRRTLLNNEEDGDTEDDSHITRVLRAYYTEKGRPFPPWLPPDPKGERPSLTSASSSFAQPIAGYLSSVTGRGQATNVQSQAPPPGRGSLSDLWETPNANAGPVQPQSLRNARRPAPAQMQSSSGQQNLAPPTLARPLPSQRAGSYQNAQLQPPGRQAFDPTPPGSSGSAGGTAQDRLKARLRGTGGGDGRRGGSPVNGGYQPPSTAGGSYGSGGAYGR